MEIAGKTYLEIIKENKKLGSQMEGEKLDITFLSNLTFNKIKDVLEYPLRKNCINASVKFGNYDNIIQDSLNQENTDIVIIHQDLLNFSNQFNGHQIFGDKTIIDNLKKEICNQIDIVLSNLKDTKLVIFNSYTNLCSSSNFIKNNHIDDLSYELNKYLIEKSKSILNLRICNIEKIISYLGVNNSIDLKTFYAFKDLYKTSWLIEYAQRVQHLIYPTLGKLKKAIIMDCDNTLWKGILGEDGFDYIEMSSETKSGEIFKNVQKSLIQLSKMGVLVCLCSKNNLDDVKEVFERHPDITLQHEHITLMKVNWQDKASNIQEIANELNIGVDSFIFVDDSDFEVNLVKERHPIVDVFQVPKNLSEYPLLMNKISNYFYRDNITESDLKKSQEYKKQAVRAEHKAMYSNIDDFISSLEIEVKINKNDIKQLARMEQMAQKTNQFNFTTIRHSANEIKSFIESKDNDVYCINVKDKFGDSGLTGMIITSEAEDKTLEILTFLMSCRVIGRNIEHAFLHDIIDEHRKLGFKKVISTYNPSRKNQQIENFFEGPNFDVKKMLMNFNFQDEI